MIETISIIFILLFSVIAHECAHGFVALWCGDPTAKEAGRLTANPLKHIDLFGTIVLPTVLRIMGFFPIGWAKAVPVDFTRLRHPKKDMLWVGLSGPAVNIFLALSAALIHTAWPSAPIEARQFFVTVLVVNLFLAFFNLTPIPPLDGSRVIFSLLPDKIAYEYAKMERFGIIVVLVLLNFGLFDIIATLVGMCLRVLGITAYS
jgi:Zn-dependent protease